MGGGQSKQTSNSTTITDSYNQTFSSVYNTNLQNVGNIAVGQEAISALLANTNTFDVKKYLPYILAALAGLALLKVMK